MSAQNVPKTITAQNTFSDWLTLEPGMRFSLNVWGTFSAVVTLPKTYDGGTTVLDDEINFTSPVNEISLPAPESAQYRIGVKTGDYTSGTVNVRLGRR